MARKRRGRAIHGWLILDKPLGVSSAQAVAKARWALEAQKAGHAGTLDPLATGVLAVAFGEATKTVALVQDGLKTYRFGIRLGQATKTDDAEGAVIAESAERPSDHAIETALDGFRGDILQVPPLYSAVKANGARAYDLARAGAVPELAPRPLWVERLDLVARDGPDQATLDLVCGKGGYVRSIARDLGRALGCHAHVSELRRIASGAFTEADALSFDALDAVRAGERTAPLLPVETGLASLPEIPVDAAAAGDLRQGRSLSAPDCTDGPAWASHGGQAVALCSVADGRLRPNRVLLHGQDSA
ncbi:MAG: tRNA pseudouridine(55) synthase TruB [Pseudomonadota bacterium]